MCDILDVSSSMKSIGIGADTMHACRLDRAHVAVTVTNSRALARHAVYGAGLLGHAAHLESFAKRVSSVFVFL